MAVLVVGNEKNLAGLRARLVSGTVSRAAAKRISDAFRHANPGVNFDALEPGTVLSVPSLPELSGRADLSLDAAMGQAADAVVANASEILDALGETAARLTKEARAERREVAKAIDRDEVRAAIERTRGLGDDVEAVSQAIEQAESEAKERAAKLKKAADQWAKDLKELRATYP
jgi:hypothetical protein